MLRSQLPAFSHWFGLHPWDVERLTFGEIEVYQRWLVDQMQEGDRG